MIERLQTAFRDGSLERNDYWKAIQEHHLLVDQYRNLIQGPLLDHIEIHKEDLQVVLKNGLRFVWDPHEIRQASSVLVNNGDYESDELYTVLTLAQHATNILDIGANIGWYTLHLAQAVQTRDGIIYAFEPIPYTYEVLQRNLALNPEQAQRVQTYNLALGETTESVEFYIPAFQGSVAASRNTLYPEDQNKVIEGQMVVLDEFAKSEKMQAIDLLKCDVEGAELFVLRGGMGLIERDRPMIMLEMLRKWSAKFDYHPNDIIRLLTKKGYGCWYMEAGQFTALEAMTEQIEAVNFFFLHADKHKTLTKTGLSPPQAAANLRFDLNGSGEAIVEGFDQS